MDDDQAQDNYEERLREVFNSFDSSGCGSLSPDELADLCLALHLEDASSVLLDTLLGDQDRLTSRVDFDQFKNALILVLSTNLESPEAQQETPAEPDEIQPKFVKGAKRYGRRSTPEFIEPLSGTPHVNATEGGEQDVNDESAIPRKRERWNAHDSSMEEYEAEGQMHLWNPDEPSTPRKSSLPLSARLEERVREACDDLAISWDGCAGHAELVSLCEYLGLEISGDVIQNINIDDVMNVQEFVSNLVNHNKPPTPSASTPYRQLKRLHSTQPFDDEGRRTANPSTLTSTIGTRLFSTLDDGTGFTPVEYLVDAWLDEGIENSNEILQALNFDLDGKLSLSDLTSALENELLVSKNGIHQAAVASFKAEIRYLLECVDGEHREKEKLRVDLEKAEKLKSQLAAEVDEHHSSIEHTNSLNLRKLDQEHREKLAAVRVQLNKENEQIQQQAALQRDELEAEIQKFKDDESFLRDHLSITIKENRRLEMELLESSERIMEMHGQLSKLQTSLDNVLMEKFGDLDPSSAEFFLQEERIKQLRSGYEAQCRELQDRIDELQSELHDLHTLAPNHQSCHKPLSEELESKSPGMESDPGIGSEEVHPFSLSLEAEMKLEQLREQHSQEIAVLRNQLENKINELNKSLENQGLTHEDQAALSHQHQEEVEGLRAQVSSLQHHTDELQSQLEQAELERTRLLQSQVNEKEAKELQHEEELGALRQQLTEAEKFTAGLVEQLKTSQHQKAAMEKSMEELTEQHTTEMSKLERDVAVMESSLKEKIAAHEEDKKEFEKMLVESSMKEKELLQQNYEARLEKSSCEFEEERSKTVQTLTEQWQAERAQLDEQNNELLQGLLEEAMLKLVQEQEEKETQARDQWEREKADLHQQHRELLLSAIVQERLQLQEQQQQREDKLKQEWEKERLQLEEDYEGMLQERLDEEREKFEAEKEELEKGLDGLLEEERARLEEGHQEALQKLATKHSEERNSLSIMLSKLREDIAEERKEIESSFSQRLKNVEDRFSGDHESVTERFQADVLKLEEQYQSELKKLSEGHAQEKQLWEAQMQRAVEISEEHRKKMEALEQHQQSEVEVEALVMSNQQLQEEKDNLISVAQTKEMELDRQFNDLHDRLQQSLLSQEELHARSIQKRMETELLLNQMVEDFQHERAELQKQQSELELKYNEMLSFSKTQVTERIELLTERDDSKMKIQELEMLLQQAAVDFELERQELQGCVTDLEERLKGHDQYFSAEQDLQKTQVGQVEMKMEDEDGTEHCDVAERSNLPKVLDSSNSEFCHKKDTSECSNSYNYTVDLNIVTNKKEALLVRQVSFEVFSHDLAEVYELCEEDEAHIDLSFNSRCSSHEHRPDHEVVGDPSLLRETGGLHEPSVEDTKESCLPGETEFGSFFENLTTMTEDNSHDSICESEELLTLYHAATEENVLLQEKILLLEQKTTLLQNVLTQKNEKLKAGQRFVEENYRLKVKMFLLVEHVRVLEVQALQMTELQIAYEDCMCENAKLKEQNIELEQRVWSLESCLNIFPKVQDESLLDEVAQMRTDNLKLSEMFDAIQIAESEFLDSTGVDDHSSHKTELQDKSHNLSQTSQACSSKNNLLTEANQTLQRRIVTLQDEDLKEKQEELIHAREDLEKEKIAAQKAVENFNTQISDLRRQSQNLESENLMLSEKNTQNVAEMEKLKVQLARGRTERGREEALNPERQKQTVEEQKSVGRKTRSEKLKTQDETLQAVNKQNARLKSGLSAVQHQRDSLRYEVALLNKRLQNCSEKPSPQSQSRKLVLKPRKDSKPVLKKQEELRHAGETASRLDSPAHKHQSSLVKALEQENASLKQELELRKEASRSCEAEDGRRELEELKLENDELKEQLTRANTQAIEAFQAHLRGLLPSSPHRLPRGQRAEDPDNVQDERWKRVKETEARVREMETSFHNVKLMLKEKVAQLNDQAQKNGKAGVLIGELYAENSKLLKLLETAEHRLKRTEKMNYLLEEKISSLNKIVRRLNPVNLSLMSHHSQ